MRERSIEERRVIAEYFVNIGVAWFVAGIVSFFLSPASGDYGRIIWGGMLSYMFLKIAVFFTREEK
ncbi:MAG: hypothetical protein HYU80_00200 [Candidatus Blackburnbacteria bacterium]|nr:hypothetical protein [Candidatus Blackburnbacteria bacterium]